jgi:hypothetical protein
MATKFTYPGVYLEEIESSVRPIVGVDTSVAALLGLPLTGPRTATPSAADNRHNRWAAVIRHAPGPDRRRSTQSRGHPRPDSLLVRPVDSGRPAPDALLGKVHGHEVG